MPSLISSTRSQNTLTLSLVATCPVEFSPRRVWDISENYLLCAERDSASYEEMPGYPSHILFTLLPHPGEPMHLSGDPFSLPVATFHLGLARNMRLSAFKLDEKADLLATVCRVNNWNSAGQFLFFYSFAQGTPHQHAVQTILHLDSGLDRTGIVRVSIYKDHIGILLGYYIYILNWRTGDCRLRYEIDIKKGPFGGYYECFSFLSEDVFLCTTKHPLGIDFWLANIDFDRPDFRYEPVLTLLLPTVNQDHTVENLKCTSLGWPSTDDDIIVFSAKFMHNFKGVPNYCDVKFVVHRLTLLSLIEGFRVRVATKHGCNKSTIPWEEWGPVMTCCFNGTFCHEDLDFSQQFYSSFRRNNVSSARLLTIYRFPRSAPREKKQLFPEYLRENRYPGVETGPFVDPVFYSLPATVVTTGEMPYDWPGVLVDNRRRVFGIKPSKQELADRDVGGRTCGYDSPCVDVWSF